MKEFKFIHQKKIQGNLVEPYKMRFTEIRHILDAYQFFQFQKNSNNKMTTNPESKKQRKQTKELTRMS